MAYRQDKSPNISGRSHPQGIILCILLATFLSETAVAKSIAIFLPHVYSVKEIEATTKTDKTLSKFQIKVFARVKDLLASHDSEEYDVLLLPSAFKHSQIPDMKPKYTLLRDGLPQRRVHMVKLKEHLKRKPSLAAIDLLGTRKKSKSLVRQTTGSVIKKIKLVKKGADLYPMLSLNNVSHILIDDLDMKRVMKQSEVKLIVVQTFTVGNPLLFVANGDHFPELLNIESKTLGKLGYQKVGIVK